MTVAITHARAQIGIAAPIVTVEADTVNGLPRTLIVGLPEAAVKESKDRVFAAIKNAEYKNPDKKITVNLAPADLPKAGGRYDLAIAISILAASGQIETSRIHNTELLGELALDGSLRAVSGVVPAVMQASRGNRTLIVPAANETEAALVESDNILIANNLSQVIRYLEGTEQLSRPTLIPEQHKNSTASIDDIRGQPLAKRALLIAAAGSHNILFIGPPGTGKTMLASRLAGLLPNMTVAESLTVASINSISNLSMDTWQQRPFRSPHHTSSAVALVGGGNPPVPGEISLAHHGVLFLDELPEFSRHVLEVLREPLESGEITISRANQRVTFPSRFQLIAAMNPCPCGYAGERKNRCICSTDQISRYRSRISGPLIDRIDLHVDVPTQPISVISHPEDKPRQAHLNMLRQVKEARHQMLQRAGKLNAQMSSKQTQQHCRLRPIDQEFLEVALEKLGLSTRGYFKILKIARTIADIEASEQILTNHLTEAIGYRQLDRFKRQG